MIRNRRRSEICFFCIYIALPLFVSCPPTVDVYHHPLLDPLSPPITSIMEESAVPAPASSALPPSSLRKTLIFEVLRMGAPAASAPEPAVPTRVEPPADRKDTPGVSPTGGPKAGLYRVDGSGVQRVRSAFADCMRQILGRGQSGVQVFVSVSCE